MAVKDATKTSKKRKQSVEVEDVVEKPMETGTLEMLSDDEDGVDAVSDDGEVDEFPEIDTQSDSEDDELYDSDGNEPNSDEEDEEGDITSDSGDSELYIFPKAKTITSDITGHPKRVYPEIEPNYDSDSSTEDVSHSVFSTDPSRTIYSGSQSCRRCTNALV